MTDLSLVEEYIEWAAGQTSRGQSTSLEEFRARLANRRRCDALEHAQIDLGNLIAAAEAEGVEADEIMRVVNLTHNRITEALKEEA
jgi:hypothetical protein